MARAEEAASISIEAGASTSPAAAAQVELMTARVGLDPESLPDEPRVGLRWAELPSHNLDVLRSTELSAREDVLANPAVTFYSLHLFDARGPKPNRLIRRPHGRMPLRKPWKTTTHEEGPGETEPGPFAYSVCSGFACRRCSDSAVICLTCSSSSRHRCRAASRRSSMSVSVTGGG